MVSTPLVVLASARKKSNTKTFANIVFANTEHETIDLLDYYIEPYNYLHTYPGQDGFITVIDKILLHETIILASPVYWYAMSGSMKIFLDRFTDLLKVHKDKYKQLKGKSMLLLAVGSDAELPDGFEVPFELTARYFGMSYRGCIYATSSGIKTIDHQAVQAFIDKM